VQYAVRVDRNPARGRSTYASLVSNPEEKSQTKLLLGFIPEVDPVEHPEQNPVCDLEQHTLAPGLFATNDAANALWNRLDAWASQLGDPEKRNETRVRHLARMIAVLRAKLLLNERRREEMLHAGDTHFALVLDRVIQTDSRRLEGLLREHRESCRGGARVVQIAAVAVGERPQVSVVTTRVG
jgi:hypothetical protein